MIDDGQENYDDLDPAEQVIRDQALTIEGLGQTNTALGDILVSVGRDVRALKDVPIGELEACLTAISNRIDGAFGF